MLSGVAYLDTIVYSTPNSIVTYISSDKVGSCFLLWATESETLLPTWYAFDACHRLTKLANVMCIISCSAYFSKIIRLHRSTTAAYCYRPSSVVCRSVCRLVCQSVSLVSRAKTAEPIEMPFGLRTRVGPGNHVLDGGPDLPMGRSNFEGERGVPL